MPQTKPRVSAYVVVFFEKSSGIIANLLSLYLLSKYVPPEHFSTFAIVTIIVNALAIIVDSGLSGGLIFKKLATEDDFNTVFTFSIVVALIIQFLLFILSGYIAELYDNPDLVEAVKLVSFLLTFKVLASYYTVKLILDNRFIYQLVAFLASTVIGISFAVYLASESFGYLALISQPIISTIALYFFLIFSGYKGPKIGFDKESWLQMFSFGAKLSISSIIQTSYQQSPTLIFGLTFTKQQTGLFSQAFRLGMVGPGLLKAVVDKVGFPFLTRLRSDDALFIRNYRWLRRTSLGLATIGTTILSGLSPIIIKNFLGPDWEGATPYLTVLSLMITGVCLDSVSRTAMKSLGLANDLLIIEILKRSISIFILIGAFNVSLDVFLWSIVVLSLVHGLVNEVYVLTKLKKPIIPDSIESVIIMSIPIVLFNSFELF